MTIIEKHEIRQERKDEFFYEVKSKLEDNFSFDTPKFETILEIDNTDFIITFKHSASNHLDDMNVTIEIEAQGEDKVLENIELSVFRMRKSIPLSDVVLKLEDYFNNKFFE